ncbi:equilibrative nucleotide transporter 3-like [Hibiscus syriacus]|uniref:Equilibrative nucleotide transporter 3-like n=1 Tax=Hibiscus syriacus TaxID=106335 RepID=A0A6A2XUX4_HIBSY|nr:equilibrative nucleotide transporter 3-like [Hibiscus syriacus]
MANTFLSQSVSGQDQPLKGGDYSSPNTVPALPAEVQAQVCQLDLYALEVSALAPAAPELPMMPDDSQKCVNTLQKALVSKRVRIPQPNASCDAIVCFCGIRLHQISSLSCPAAFNVSGLRNATPTAAVKNLERDCRDSSYAGCTKCMGSLQKANTERTGARRATERPSDQDVQQRLPADGADMAPHTQQNGVHTNRIGRAPGHNVHRAPSRVKLQPGSIEHAVSRRFSPVRECPVVSTATGVFHVRCFVTHRFGLAVWVAPLSCEVAIEWDCAFCHFLIALFSSGNVGDPRKVVELSDN